MILNAYSIYDRKSLHYNFPWYQPTHGAATRLLQDLVDDPATQVGRHPSDYVLYQVGTFDGDKGQLIPLSPLVHIMDAIALVKLPSQQELFERQQVVERGQSPNGGR